MMNTSIIIADDHPLMLRGINDFLESKGFNILGSAQDGQAAYNLIVKENPDIAILAEEAMVSLETTITELKEALPSEQDGPPPAPAAASKKNKSNP